VIIWEELPMINRTNFECVQALMHQIHGEDGRGILGTALMIATGDFRQVAPVVKRGSRKEVFDASIRSAAYWKTFEILTLTQPMRSGQDIDFTQWLDDVGDGKIASTSGEDDYIEATQLEKISSLKMACEFAFPFEVLKNPLECIQRAILSPLNVEVDLHNAWILSLLPAEPGESQTAR
jgi:hypothetical protein